MNGIPQTQRLDSVVFIIIITVFFDSLQKTTILSEILIKCKLCYQSSFEFAILLFDSVQLLLQTIRFGAAFALLRFALGQLQVAVLQRKNRTINVLLSIH